MEVIDCHCHIYPDKIAQRATEAVGKFYNAPMHAKDGATSSLLAATEDTPIGRFIVHSVATRPDQVRNINDFIAGECEAHPEFTGFMTLHQDLTDDELEAEIDHALAQDLRGIKLHPDTQQVNMDDPRLMRVYEIAQSQHLPIIMHCGDYRYDYSHPRRMQRILHDFPGLTVDAAHFGGWSIFDLAVEFLENENCYLDASSAMAWLGHRRTRELTRLYGTERVMFGSDFPMWDPGDEYQEFIACEFTDAELENLLRNNALRFLGEA